MCWEVVKLLFFVIGGSLLYSQSKFKLYCETLKKIKRNYRKFNWYHTIVFIMAMLMMLIMRMFYHNGDYCYHSVVISVIIVYHYYHHCHDHHYHNQSWVREEASPSFRPVNLRWEVFISYKICTRFTCTYQAVCCSTWWTHPLLTIWSPSRKYTWPDHMATRDVFIVTVVFAWVWYRYVCRDVFNFRVIFVKLLTHRIHDAIIASLLRQNDVATSFWRNNDVIVASRVRWVMFRCCGDYKICTHQWLDNWLCI